MITLQSLTVAETATLERQLAKLKPSSQRLLMRMIFDGQAYVRGDKIRIRSGYESLALTFQFVKK